MIAGRMSTTTASFWFRIVFLAIGFDRSLCAPNAYEQHFMSSYRQRTPGAEEIPSRLMPPVPRKAARYLSPEDFERARVTPVLEPSEDGIKAMQLPTLFEGDIMGIPLDDMRLQMDAGDIFRYPQYSALNLVTFPDKLWPKGKIPYTLEEDLNEHERTVIAQAIQEYKEKTCIRFTPKDDYDYDYVHIRKNRDLGCSSYVGRAGGNQTVSLEVDKCFSKGIVAHELMHVLGFFHEHSRTDRDKFVKIVDENILPGMLRNFEKYPHKIMDTLDMPYDYGSVMHYHKLAFSRNGKPTIVPFESAAEIGQRYRLSDIDAAKVNKLYSCQEFAHTWMSSTTTSEQPSSTTSTSATSTTTSSTSTIGSSSTTTTTTDPITNRPYTEEKNSTSESTTRTTDSTPGWTMPTIASSTTTIASTTGSSAPATTTKKKCEDLNDHCKMWSELGHCKWSEKYMASYCRQSCSLCDSWPDFSSSTPSINNNRIDSHGSKDCSDQNLFCGYWAKIGECERETKFMNIFCKRSCGGCDQRQQGPLFEGVLATNGQQRRR